MILNVVDDLETLDELYDSSAFTVLELVESWKSG